MISIKAFGGLEVRDEVRGPITALLAQPKRSALLAYLVLAHPGGFCRRDTLLALFWPDQDEEGARRALSQALTFLRRHLGGDVLVSRGPDELGADPLRVRSDVQAFEQALAARDWEAALTHYQGSLLEGLHVAGAAPFVDWVDRERERLREAASGAAWKHAHSLIDAGRLVDAERTAQRALMLVPTDESPVRAFIEALAAAGDRAAAIRFYEKFKGLLARELEVEPAGETRAVVEAVRDGRVGPTVASGARLPERRPREREDEPSAETAALVTQLGLAVPPAPRQRRRRSAIVAAAAVTLVLVAAGWWALTSSNGAESPAPVNLAVLPFVLVGDPRDAYLADHVTGAVSSALGMMPHLQVIAAGSMVEEARTLTPRRLAERLSATHLLQLAVESADGRLNVRLELTDPRAGRTILRRVYDGLTADVFKLDDTISRDVAGALGVAVPPAVQQRISRSPTSSVRAMRAFEMGRFFFNEWDRRGYDSAIAYLEEAVAADSNFAPAWALLADTYTEKLEIFAPRDPELRRKATVAANVALKIDPELPHAYIALGNLLWSSYVGWAHDAALARFLRAEELQPSMSTAHDRVAHVFAHICLLDRALEEVKQAQLLDPSDNGPRWREVYVLTLQQRWAEVLATIARLPPSIAPQFLPPMEIEARVYLGQLGAARQVAERQVDSFPSDPWARASLALVQAAQADTLGAVATMAATVPLLPGMNHKHHPEYVLAQTNAMIGRKAEAVEYLSQAVANGFPCYERFNSDSLLLTLHGHPPFDSVMRELRQQWVDYRAKYALPIDLQ